MSFFTTMLGAASNVVNPSVAAAPVTEQVIPVDSVIVLPEDQEFALHQVFSGWSVRRSKDGDFVSPQGATLVDAIIQIEATPYRPKVITGKILDLDLHRKVAKVRGDTDKIFHITLGEPLVSYDKWWDRILLMHPLNSSDLPGLFAQVAE